MWNLTTERPQRHAAQRPRLCTFCRSSYSAWQMPGQRTHRGPCGRKCTCADSALAAGRLGPCPRSTKGMFSTSLVLSTDFASADAPPAFSTCCTSRLGCLTGTSRHHCDVPIWGSHQVARAKALYQRPQGIMSGLRCKRRISSYGQDGFLRRPRPSSGACCGGLHLLLPPRKTRRANVLPVAWARPTRADLGRGADRHQGYGNLTVVTGSRIFALISFTAFSRSGFLASNASRAAGSFPKLRHYFPRCRAGGLRMIWNCARSSLASDHHFRFRAILSPVRRSKVRVAAGSLGT